MAQGTLDLSTFRRMRAVREHGGAGFAELWNDHVADIWSVVRALCRKDREAIGWCSSFRVFMEAHLNDLDPVSPLPPQIGTQLYRHICGHFVDRQPMPSPLPEGPAGIAMLPLAIRLAYLIELFFDVPEDIYPPEILPRLQQARRALEPVNSTDLRIELQQSLHLAPPPAVQILPPGQEPPPARRWGLIALIVGCMLMGGLGGLFYARRQSTEDWDWHEAATIHTRALSHPETLIPSTDPAQLSQTLASRGLSRSLSRVPDLSAAGLSLFGGALLPGSSASVVLRYQKDDQIWSLQHHLRPEPDSNISQQDTFRAWSEGQTAVVGWRDGADLWILGAEAPVADVVVEATLLKSLNNMQ